MKRAGIYFFFDAQGIIDECVEVYLRGLRPCFERLLVVCGGALPGAARARLESVADEVLVRENEGFDVGAYKAGLEHIGWAELARYDEVALMNDTYYGPVYPFQEMFGAMALRTLDFWGVTMRHGCSLDSGRKSAYGHVPAHLRACFLVIRRSLLTSGAYRRFWDAMPIIRSREDAFRQYEAIFTKKFNDLGFQSAAYVDTSDLVDVTDDPLMTMPTELVQNRRCPVFKRELFFNAYEELMESSCGQAVVELWDYLTHDTDYDVNLIWDDLLRTANMYDLKQRMQLNYILPRDEPAPAAGDGRRVALFAHLYYPDMLQMLLPRIDAMPKEANLYLTTDTNEKAALLRAGMGERRCEIKVIGNRGREYAGFLIAMRDELMAHDIAVILHGKKSHYRKPYLNGDSFLYHCIENTVPTADYVRRVLALFARDARLGLLVPPPPAHGWYYPTIGREWGNNFANTKALCDALGVHVPISEDKPPVAPLGGMFWFRTQALKAVFTHPWTAGDFPEEPCTEKDGTIMHAVERCYPFVAQQAGYYSAWVMSDRFAAMMTTNQYKALSDISLSVGANYYHFTYPSLLKQLRLETYSFGKRVKTAAKVLLGSKNAWRMMLLRDKLKKMLQR